MEENNLKLVSLKELEDKMGAHCYIMIGDKNEEFKVTYQTVNDIYLKIEEQAKKLSFIERLQIEESELSRRIDKLKQFINFSSKFKELDKKSRNWLEQQLEAMQNYRYILRTRLAIVYEEKNEK